MLSQSTNQVSKQNYDITGGAYKRAYSFLEKMGLLMPENCIVVNEHRNPFSAALALEIISKNEQLLKYRTVILEHPSPKLAALALLKLLAADLPQYWETVKDHVYPSSAADGIIELHKAGLLGYWKVIKNHPTPPEFDRLLADAKLINDQPNQKELDSSISQALTKQGFYKTKVDSSAPTVESTSTADLPLTPSPQ